MMVLGTAREMQNASLETQRKSQTQNSKCEKHDQPLVCFGFRISSFHCISKLAFCISLAVFVAGCSMVGPDYQRPDAAVSQAWMEADDARLKSTSDDLATWWAVFDDPVLGRLVDSALAQNLTLRIAGLRVIEAQARRGIAISTLFPQQQNAIAGYNRAELSENRANQGNPGLNHTFDDWQVGFDAAWELDVWGRFRRGVEAADAGLLASVADYDDVLVSLIAEVALTYVQIRTLEERLAVARSNVGLQNRSFEIAGAKFDNGLVTELDVAQSQSLLRGTEANIPVFLAQLRQAQNNLCFLLGIPPRDLTEMLGGAGHIPAAPKEVVVGVPAELLRRRPDVRRAERTAAAQSAQIGVAVSDFYPRLSLVGTISLGAEDFKNLFEGDSFEAFGGPNLRWAILNYGRIRNNVRVQDAVFQQLLVNYENTVLRAQREAEDAIVGFLRAQDQVALLSDGVAASQRAVDLSNLQYREGTVNYVRVLNAQEFLATQQDTLVAARGSVALNLVALYKALGGGWQLRGTTFVDEQTKEQMRTRTSWGEMLDSETDVDTAGKGTETDTGWWRWRWWWPRW